MKKILLTLMLLIGSICFASEMDGDEIFDIKQNAFALYNTNHINEAYTLLEKIPLEKRDYETLIILANIEEDNNQINKAIKTLKSAVQKNPAMYKAYYNLGCIYMKRKIYSFASENFELAIKYNKKNPYLFYNLGCAELSIGDFNKAKKNFIKAIYLKNDEKDFYYNLAYANKKLNKEKEAKKIIDFYNKTFVK